MILRSANANNVKSTFSSMNKNKTYQRCIPLFFGVCLSFYWLFWPYCVTTVTPRSNSGYAIKTKKKNGETTRKHQTTKKLHESFPARQTFRHDRTEWSPIRSVIIRAINKIGRPRSGSVICFWWKSIWIPNVQNKGKYHWRRHCLNFANSSIVLENPQFW